ncbi:MAG TPA: ECF transporter S component [Chondromyces sp.]|nr:ECF transporter S component [Chondromyces sp.]
MSVKKISMLAMFAALSVVGGLVKIPAIVSSVALDAFPALIAGAVLGAGPGATVAAIGHLASALIGGMPLGPLHFAIAVEMFLIIWVFSKLYRYGKGIPALLVFILLNGLGAPLPFYWIVGPEFYMAAVPSLFIASAINGILAWMAAPRLAALFEKVTGTRVVKG